MAFLDHNGESEFPLSKDLVYEAMCKAIPSIKRMKIEYADKLQGRIMVKAKVSLFSWGENIPIQLITVNENLTKVQITSSPKTGIMFGGAFDMGKNRKNIENILSATSRILSTNDTHQTSKDYLTNQDNIAQSNNFQTNPEIMENEKSNAWYEKTWLVILLCIVFFPIGLYALWKNSSINKVWKIVITAIIAIILIANISGNNKKSLTTTVTESNKADESKLKQWTLVYEFKGNGVKKSPLFELTGGNARIKYKYKAQSGLGMGMFAVYVVDEGKDIMVEGGIPEIMTQAENEESESALQKGAGRYYLSVNASGNWAITVEEEK